MWRAGWLHTCDSAGRKGHLVLGHPAFEVKNKRFFQDPLLDMFWDTSCGETSVDMIYIYIDTLFIILFFLGSFAPRIWLGVSMTVLDRRSQTPLGAFQNALRNGPIGDGCDRRVLIERCWATGLYCTRSQVQRTVGAGELGEKGTNLHQPAICLNCLNWMSMLWALIQAMLQFLCDPCDAEVVPG